VRSDGSGSVKILKDTTDARATGLRDYEDDPTLPFSPESILWYMIAELDFGTIRDSRESEVACTEGKCYRASFDRIRVLVFISTITLPICLATTFVYV
jgi:hypothetical protein